MKKFLLFFLLYITTANAYQISSNHSYIKNSNFIADHYININGYGDFRGEYNTITNKQTTTTPETKDIFVDSQVEVSLDINIEKQLDEITTIGVHYIPTYNSSYKEKEKYFLYIDGYYGKIELGNTYGIYDNMRIGADTIALGSGGIAGNFVRKAKLDNGFLYLLSPNSFLNQNLGFYNNSINQDNWNDSKYLPKVNYISPELYGFQAGISIIPNVAIKQEYVGDTTILNLTNPINLGTFINYGVNYINSFDNLGIAISVVGEQNLTTSFNKTSDIKEEIKYQFKSFEFGANINYFGWTIAASRGSLDTNVNNLLNSDPLKNIIRDKGSYTTYGLTYELANILMSATFFDSEYKDYTAFNSISVAIEKKMSKGYVLYGEYTKYTSSSINQATKLKTEHDGDAIYIGVMLNFE